ncbi:MAG: O-methyltransferase [bacterium]|nr:O-methyltransferase [bacterium]
MFHDIPEAILGRMHELETWDFRDRQDGTPRMKRLRQIPPETGRFLAILAATAPEGDIVEIGASAGYSALWLSLACRATGRSMTTYEVLPDKVRLAHETFAEAGVDDIVHLRHADARVHLDEHPRVGFCFIDAEKEVYADCYEGVAPRLVSGGLLVADNVISHKEELRPVVEQALNDHRVDAVVVPIGKGELVCRKL